MAEFHEKGATEMEKEPVQKQKYCIEIADIQLTILSDESEEFVRSTVKLLDTEIRELTVQNKRCAKIDAAILCALDSLGEKLKLEKKVRNLEAQIDLYEANLRRLRADNAVAPKAETAPQAEKKIDAPTVAEKVEKTEKTVAPEKPEKPKKAEKSTAEQLTVEGTVSQKTAEKSTPPSTEEPKVGVHGDKLKQIESLLRRRSESAPAENTAPATESKQSDKLREIEELLRAGGRSLSEALEDARKS